MSIIRKKIVVSGACYREQKHKIVYVPTRWTCVYVKDKDKKGPIIINKHLQFNIKSAFNLELLNSIQTILMFLTWILMCYYE